MSDTTDLYNTHRILDLTFEVCADNSARCVRQFTPLYNQRKRLVSLREKLEKQRHARAAELRALEELVGITSSGGDMFEARAGITASIAASLPD